jgi:drug/metabolite transporter (DMT)-like permease
MLFALLAAVLFAASAVCGQSLSRQLGGVTANAVRITIACALLGLITWAFCPGQIHSATFRWFLLSGVLGFGFGDVALYLAYPLLGARTAVLVNLCLATLVGALADRIFLGTRLAPAEIAAAALTLTGVVLAMHKRDEPFQWNAGLFLTLFAGTCQGFGLMLSRLAQGIAKQQNLEMSGPAQAFQRTMGGVLIGWIAFAILRSALKGKSLVPPTARTAQLPFWILGASFFGPVAGVSFMQVALQRVDSSAIVSAITSTAPLMLLPISRYIDREAPTKQAILGSFVAVGGVVAIAYIRWLNENGEVTHWMFRR